MNAPTENIKRARHVPKALGECIGKATRTAVKKCGFAEQRILTDWALIVGERFAAVSLPLRLTFPAGKQNGGTLTIQVGGSWASEIQHLTPIILEKIAAYFGYKAVASVKIIQAPLPAAGQAEKTPALPEIDSEQQKKLDTLAGEVDDPDLQKALISLGKALLQKTEVEKPGRKA